MGKALIVYFSRKGENYWHGSMKNLEKGNTEIVAEMIAELTGGELFEVKRITDYAAEYRKCVEEAKEEFQTGVRPEIKTFKESIDDYDTIFVGFPNWCGTMPMVMFTFLEHYDWSGKRIFPFCTNEGSGMGRSEDDLKKSCPGATIGKGLSIHGAEAAQSRDKVEDWVKNTRQ